MRHPMLAHLMYASLNALLPNLHLDHARQLAVKKVVSTRASSDVELAMNSMQTLVLVGLGSSREVDD